MVVEGNGMETKVFILPYRVRRLEKMLVKMKMEGR